ncbi:leucyl/phenylalanyl-tRNA--protein transferase [Desulfonauticus submarinus]
MFYLNSKPIFPPIEFADKDGLLAIGGDLSPERLISAYSMGIFPWYEKDTPILWWAPFPRPVIFPSEFHISKSLKKILKKNIFSITFDANFFEVIFSCAELRKEQGTWLVPEMIEAYSNLHKLGYAHSVEVWKDGKLVGGLYGVSIGKAFFGESMFHLVDNASKVGLWGLLKFLQKNDFIFLDCQQSSPHVLRFGAKEIGRDEYKKLLKHALSYPTLFCWQNKSVELGL